MTCKDLAVLPQTRAAKELNGPETDSDSEPSAEAQSRCHLDFRFLVSGNDGMACCSQVLRCGTLAESHIPHHWTLSLTLPPSGPLLTGKHLTLLSSLEHPPHWLWFCFHCLHADEVMLLCSCISPLRMVGSWSSNLLRAEWRPSAEIPYTDVRDCQRRQQATRRKQLIQRS